MKIIGTGLSGLVGSRIMALLSPEFTFENLSLETGVDITDPVVVSERIHASDAPWVFHFAAKTDVDGAEKEKDSGETSQTWIVNVTATEHIVAASKATNKHVLYLSTDYVFDGYSGPYTEDSIPNPKGWYAKTKYEGERLVSSLGEHGLVVRIANPYSGHAAGKTDFVHKIAELLKNGQPIKAPSDQLFIPTFIDDIACAIRVLVAGGQSGLYHVVGSQAISPYAAALAIADHFRYSRKHITETTFLDYFSNRAPRPFQAVLKNDRITRLGVRMSSFDEGLKHL